MIRQLGKQRYFLLLRWTLNNYSKQSPFFFAQNVTHEIEGEESP